MNKQHKISIPEPCNENWDKMTLKDNGRFCLNCSKTVIDFTTMLPDEIQHFFTLNQNKSICGRFKNTQLDEIIIQIPSNVFYSQTQYHKMFLLALFVVMGTTLFSCGEKGGNKRKIDKVEIVKNTMPEPIVVGEIPIDTNNYGKNAAPPPPPPPPLKANQIKFVKPKNLNQNNKAVAFYPPAPIICGETISKKKDTLKDNMFITGMVIGTNPDFPEGIEQFYTFFGNEFKTPENIPHLKTKIRITFSVEIDGSLTYVETTPTIDKILKKEIIRVLKLSPQWKPGESNGKKIRTNYSLPISIQ